MIYEFMGDGIRHSNGVKAEGYEGNSAHVALS